MSDDLTDEERDAINYRFSGYQLPKIQLDLTGAANYHITTIHPYYVNQPDLWGKPYYHTKMGQLGQHTDDPSLRDDNINELLLD